MSPPSRGRDDHARPHGPHACRNSFSTASSKGWNAFVSFSRIDFSTDIQPPGMTVERLTSRQFTEQDFGFCQDLVRGRSPQHTTSEDARIQSAFVWEAIFVKLDSKYFDSIRVTRGRSRAQPKDPQTSSPPCQWRNCAKRGLHRAPKGRDCEGEYFYFCREHVTEYNKSYNYFAGMKESEVTDYQKAATTGHRPTWSMGVHGADSSAWETVKQARDAGAAHDPFELTERRSRPRLRKCEPCDRQAPRDFKGRAETSAGSQS